MRIEAIAFLVARLDAISSARNAYSARTHPVRVLSHRWVLRSAHGEVTVAGKGLGGGAGSDTATIAPGDATRYLGHVQLGAAALRASPVAPAPRMGLLEGSLTVVLEPDEEEVEVAIAPLALSESGEPVPKDPATWS